MQIRHLPSEPVAWFANDSDVAFQDGVHFCTGLILGRLFTEALVLLKGSHNVRFFFFFFF